MSTKTAVNPEIDTTRFVNIDDKDFTFHINKQPREVDAGEEKVMPVFVAQIGAKHLVDCILQEKHGIKDTMRDSELRTSLFAKILPDMAEEREIKPLSEDDFKKKVADEVEKQNKLIASMTGESKENEKKIEALEAEINELRDKVASIKKPGRPRKEDSELTEESET